MIAHLLADHQVPHGGVEVIAFEESFAHADVHVRAPRSAIGRCSVASRNASLVRAHGLPETTLLDPDVGKGDGTTDSVGEVSGRLEVRHRIGPRVVRGLEVSRRPVRECREPRGGPTTQVVVAIDAFERSAAYDRVPATSPRRCAWAARYTRDGTGQPAELRIVRHGRLAAVAHPPSVVVASHRSASCRRASAPSTWPLSSSRPA